MVSINDLALRPARPMADQETLSPGSHAVRWFDAPHLPHGWDCGFLMEEQTGTLLCGDLFTQGGAEHPAMLERLALANPTTLACMHGSTWKGNGANLLRALADAVSPGPERG